MESSRIKKIIAREVLDSRGNPTIEAELFTDSFSTTAIVPSGASTGIHEAHELRDGDKRYNGKGVLKAVDNINKIISKKLVGKNCTKQKELDNLMISLDGTANKTKLGANAILAVSIAVCKAGAISKKIPLYKYISEIAGTKPSMPVPQLNVINSGKHIGVKNDIQEHMILPMGFKKFSERLRAGVETYDALKHIIKKRFDVAYLLLGDEGGFAPPLKHIEDRLDLLMEAIENAGYKGKIKLGIDSASSEFYNQDTKKYTIIHKEYTGKELVSFYNGLAEKYPLTTIEDGFSEDDWEGWKLLNEKLGKKVQLVGDDLLVTNTERIKLAIKNKSCNALLLKVNQIGTVTESIQAAKLAMKNNWNVVVSHRSGESEDSFIADLAVGIGAAQVKFGAPARGERTAKYNQLLRIEESLRR